MTGAAIPIAQASAPSRQLAICVFADEKTTTPKKVGHLPWEGIVALHANRKIRPNKSGLMLGGYPVNGTRNNANVPYRSLIQLDIDTEGVKDKVKDIGRILEVTRQAPMLEEIRSGIDAYEWCAASSHWHEPQRGVIKYRIVILPDRDIQPEEYEPLLEAIDERLHGALDRNAWQWSQAFYLPSCPAENESDAFFVRNTGTPLPMDEFVHRGREILGADKHKNLVSKLGNNVQPFAPMSEADIERVNSMLSAIDPDVPRAEWRQICWGAMATRWDCAPQLIREWSEKGAKFTETDFENVVRDFNPNAGTTFGTLVHMAKQHGWADPSTIDAPAEATGDAGGAVGKGVKIDHFRAYMPLHSYIFTPIGEMWPASSVNARLPPVKVGNSNAMPASKWLDKNRPVEQMTWAPGEPMLIPDRLVANSGWIDHGGATCFNLYRPPVPQSGGEANKAGPWLDHIRKVFPDDAEHVIKWFAHRVQRPHEKINHALVFGGAQGIGKDTILEPLKRAIGPWNFEEASPQQMLGRFNGFLKSVILRVSEARDLGNVDRFQFYDHMKAYTASPPDVLRVDEKHLREHYVFNCCGVIITTNHKTDGIYLPADDRRHFVAWSDCVKDDFPPAYWNGLWGWYEVGGYAHVAAYLLGLDISSFVTGTTIPPSQCACRMLIGWSRR
jgi:hypothetical protein